MGKSPTYGKGMPAPDPEGTWDQAVIEGPDWPEIHRLLEESTRIAEKDFELRQLIPARRTAIWVRLRELGVTVKRIMRAYAVDQGDGVGKPIITHVGIMAATEKAGFVPLKPAPAETGEEA